MNRKTIVERALCTLVLVLGFALAYGLPMFGMNVAIDHGLYVAAGITATTFLPLDRSEVVEILELYRDTDGVQLALAEIDKTSKTVTDQAIRKPVIERLRSPRRHR